MCFPSVSNLKWDIQDWKPNSVFDSVVVLCASVSSSENGNHEFPPHLCVWLSHWLSFTEKIACVHSAVACPHPTVTALVTMDFKPFQRPHLPGISRGPSGFKYCSHFTKALASFGRCLLNAVGCAEVSYDARLEAGLFLRFVYYFFKFSSLQVTGFHWLCKLCILWRNFRF